MSIFSRWRRPKEPRNDTRDDLGAHCEWLKSLPTQDNLPPAPPISEITRLEMQKARQEMAEAIITASVKPLAVVKFNTPNPIPPYSAQPTKDPYGGYGWTDFRPTDIRECSDVSEEEEEEVEDNSSAAYDKASAERLRQARQQGEKYAAATMKPDDVIEVRERLREKVNAGAKGLYLNVPLHWRGREGWPDTNLNHQDILNWLWITRPDSVKDQPLVEDKPLAATPDEVMKVLDAAARMVAEHKAGKHSPEFLAKDSPDYLNVHYTIEAALSFDEPLVGYFDNVQNTRAQEDADFLAASGYTVREWGGAHYEVKARLGNVGWNWGHGSR